MSGASRWKLLAGCFALAVAWDFFYIWVSVRFEFDHRFALWLAESAPLWVRRAYLWTPHFLAARTLNALGYRFDINHYDDNTGFIVASTGLTWVIWTILLYGLAVVLLRLRKPANVGAAA